MRFTEHFGVTRRRGDDWYDPHLSVDTKLFVDPLLVLKKGLNGTWKGAHDELIAHFVLCYHLVARDGNVASLSAKRAKRLLTFPEPSEFCLGYTSVGTRGSGGGPAVARQMTDGIAVAIAAGLKDPEHIEEIGILNEGVGADRISDAVCNVLKHRSLSTRGPWPRVMVLHSITMLSETLAVSLVRADGSMRRWNCQLILRTARPFCWRRAGFLTTCRSLTHTTGSSLN